MQIDRLFGIIYLLMDKQKMTAAELAAHFEVSKRTILRDVDTLAAAGIPLYTMQGKGGGVAIMDGFILNKTVLTESEQNQIIFALQSQSATQNADGTQVLSKLQSLFKKPDTAWIEVDFSRWGTSAHDKKKFEILKNAILGRKRITFRYVSSYSEETNRSVYPLKLVFKSRAWYLQGFCTERSDYRTFKTNRMLEVCDTGKQFAGDYIPPPINPSAPPPSFEPIMLEFAPHVAYRVYDEFDEGCIEKGDDGRLCVSAAMPVDEWLCRYLLTFGDNVSVISPKDLRRKLDELDR
ncbi:YafY family transcriptional regulator [Eubacteriales bacterium OttesenSCG-928-K08]|nr:YafY family transcriptional regulator [Eubacteriales bacterium OttesenSCG-928-K08]